MKRYINLRLTAVICLLALIFGGMFYIVALKKQWDKENTKLIGSTIEHFTIVNEGFPKPLFADLKDVQGNFYKRIRLPTNCYGDNSIQEGTSIRLAVNTYSLQVKTISPFPIETRWTALECPTSAS